MIQAEVLKKYAPKLGKDTFFCQLLEGNGCEGGGTIDGKLADSFYHGHVRSDRGRRFEPGLGA